MSKIKAKCEMCEEMRILHEGYCKKCIQQLDRIVTVTYWLAQAATIILPPVIVQETAKKNEHCTETR